MDIEHHEPAAADSVPVAEDYSHLLYARGFALTRVGPPAPVGHWRRLRLGSWQLAYDPRSALSTARSGDLWVAVLGEALDLDRLHSDLSALARSLLVARCHGRGALQDAVDNLAGRFVVIDGDGRDTFLQTDATGMRSVFYTTAPHEPVVASHATLAAESVGAERGAFATGGWLPAHGAYCLPGRATPYSGVVQLTPNTELHLESGQVRRVFPRADPTESTVPDAVEQLRHLLQGQLQDLAGRMPLMTSLTAGLDSRTTLALTRPVHESMLYFTYSLRFGAHLDNADHARDLKTARELTSDLGLAHRIVAVDGAIDSQLKSVLIRNSTRVHNRSLAAAYLTQLPTDRLHVRSNLFEIGRAYYRAQRRERPPLTPEVMAGILCKKNADDPGVAAEFAAYRDATGLAEFAGYDPYDLFYWEHRSGVWLSAVYLESDIAHDTFTVLNSRRIYQKLLSVPLDARIRGDVYRGLLQSAWPELLRWPINGRAGSDGDTARPVSSPAPATSLPQNRSVGSKPPGAAGYDERHRLPIHGHHDVEQVAVPQRVGLSRHRIDLVANDPRGAGPGVEERPLALDVMVSARESENLVVIFHGATDRSKYEYPRFEWQSTLADFDASILYVADPILLLAPDITLGWYVGTAGTDVSRHCARLAQHLAAQLSAKRIVMTGTSGGGFAALAASRLIPSSMAVPFAPQTSVARYYGGHVKTFLSLAFPGHDVETVTTTFADRLDMVEQYSKVTGNYVYYVQNLRDPFHIREHLIPWAAAAGVTGRGGRSVAGDRVAVLEDLREGHGPPPRDQFVEHLRKAIEFLTRQAGDRTN